MATFPDSCKSVAKKGKGTGKEPFLSGPERYVTGPERYPSSPERYTAGPERCVSSAAPAPVFFSLLFTFVSLRVPSRLKIKKERKK